MHNNSPRPHAQSDARLVKAILIGSFDGVLARHLLYADKTNSYQILVLEAGWHSLPKHFQNLPLQRNLHRDAIGLENAARDWPAAAVTALKQKHSCLE
jgi:hypothetical protein